MQTNETIMKTPSTCPVCRRAFLRPGLVASTLALALFGAAPRLSAQSDNFDSGTLSSAWNIVPYPAAPTVSFPAVGSGKGLRIQAATGGLAFFYQNPSYTDFYVAADMAAWDATEDQAVVLLARAQNVPTVLGTTAYVCNYDANQHGAATTDRLGGEFQINRVDNLQSINTLAAAEVTLIPGRSYRLVFTGVGSLLTARIYDAFDLSSPLATIQADDATYTNGNSGILSYSRDSKAPTDVTFDNYFAAASDPDSDIAPAIRHPIAGTPQVVTRTPAARFTNFWPPGSGISFTANTFSTNLIGFPARLYLNNVPVPLIPNDPAQVTNVTFQTLDGALQANTVYAARIELQDVSGALRSTNTFWFDTFSDAFVSTEPVKTVEAEDFNYLDVNSGLDGTFQLDPITVSGLDTNGLPVNAVPQGYYTSQGSEGIDYHDARTSPETGWADYRADDVSTTQGGRQEIQDLTHMDSPTAPYPTRPNDGQRRKYAVLNIPEYEVVHTDPGEWMNYTRRFASTNYHVFLRVASFSPTQAELDLVGGDPTTTNQTTTTLGEFDIPNNLMRINYAYVPLTCSGAPVVANLGGTNTLRLTINGTPTKDSQIMSLNYLLFVPTASSPLALLSSATVGGPYAEEPSAVVNASAKTITLPQPSGTRFYRLRECPPAPNIGTITLAGTNVVITYQ